MTYYIFTPFFWILIAAGLTGLAAFVFVWQWKGSRGAVYLALLELAVAEWTITYAFEVAATTETLKIFWAFAPKVTVT